MTPATRDKLASLGQQRQRALETVTATTTELKPVVAQAAEEGASEAAIRHLTGLNRSTIREWTGKPRKPRQRTT
jgi:hypothetical protein